MLCTRGREVRRGERVEGGRKRGDRSTDVSKRREGVSRRRRKKEREKDTGGWKERDKEKEERERLTVNCDVILNLESTRVIAGLEECHGFKLRDCGHVAPIDLQHSVSSL